MFCVLGPVGPDRVDPLYHNPAYMGTGTSCFGRRAVWAHAAPIQAEQDRGEFPALKVTGNVAQSRWKALSNISIYLLCLSE